VRAPQEKRGVIFVRTLGAQAYMAGASKGVEKRSFAGNLQLTSQYVAANVIHGKEDLLTSTNLRGPSRDMTRAGKVRYLEPYAIAVEKGITLSGQPPRHSDKRVKWKLNPHRP